MKTRILFDIGANNGSRWFHELSLNQENTYVYMFEPTPYLCDVIKEKYKHLKNWFLIEKAVSNYNGKTTFNIAGHHDWGCSSLLEFKEDVDKTWYPHDPSHFKFNDSIEVDVITLESFLNKTNIPYIDYLHVDAQGSDLNVLKGLGYKINIVSKGVIEASSSAPLYKGSPTKGECISWLENHGFTKIKIIHDNQECDIEFER